MDISLQAPEAEADAERISEMALLLRLVTLCLLLLLLPFDFLLLSPPLSLAFAEEHPFNLSSLTWPTNTVDNFQALHDSDDIIEGHDSLGGFGSIDSMLQWAIGMAYAIHFSHFLSLIPCFLRISYLQFIGGNKYWSEEMVPRLGNFLLDEENVEE